MPEPSVEAGQGTQTAFATAPAPQDNPRTTTDTGTKNVMDFLDIPAEVQSQIKPREVSTELPGDVPPPPGPEPDQPPVAEQPPLEPEPAPDEDELEPEIEPEPQTAAAEQPKLDGRQKRINRLTRQKSELNEKLDQAHREAEELRQRLAKHEGQQPQQPGPRIPGQNRLHWVSDLGQLEQQTNLAANMIDWCDQNESGEGLADEQIAAAYKQDVEDGKLLPEEAKAKTIALWRREADKVVRDAPQREKELTKFMSLRSQAEVNAREAWPEMFKDGTQQNNIALQVIQANPILRSLPDGLFITGLLMEGFENLQKRKPGLAIPQTNGAAAPTAVRAATRVHKDIDERAFAPRVPIAPHVANPPTRPVTQSSKAKLDEASSNLIKDVDGSPESLAKVFAALDNARPYERPKPGTLVKS